MVTDISKALETAVGHHQAGRLAEAEAIYRQILAVEPNCAEAWHLLGVVAEELGRDADAVEYSKRAIGLRPDLAEAHNNLGNALLNQDKSGDAVACFSKALQLAPDIAEIHFNLGNALRHQGNWEDAIASYRKALLLKPNFPKAYVNLGLVFHDHQEFEKAAACHRQALDLSPDYAVAYYNLGKALKEQEKTAEAAACYRRALELKPELVEAQNNLGNILREQGIFDEALTCHQRALALRPNSAELHYNLGLVFEEQEKPHEAIACYRRAVTLKPDYIAAHVNLGNVLADTRNVSEAFACYGRALELNPDDASAHSNLSQLMLLTGDFERGWREYEWRWRTGKLSLRHAQRLQWHGEDITGKTLLLHAEQGLGDTIQFVRYASVLKKKCARVLVECQRPLKQLLKSCSGIDEVVAICDDLPAFDVHSPLLSLPRILKTSLDTVPAPVPYLFADKTLEDYWRKRLENANGFRIGVNWHGRPGRGSFRRRDIPYECIASLAQLPGVRLVSLQKGDGRVEVAGTDIPIFDPGDDVDTSHGPFMDTAAIMKNLDLVITSDTSVPHLAGALGVPVWLALPFVPDWRWLLDRSDSPWYPTMRLFRQRQPGDWASVFAEMPTEIQELQAS